MVKGSVSCPETERVKNYRETQKEWRKRPKYRKSSEDWLKKHPRCEVWLTVGVKVPATEIHHPNRWSYQHGFEVYVDFDNNGAMAVSGKAKKPKIGNGHYACHNSLKVCPICKERMCDQHAEGCQSCIKKKYPALTKKLEEDKERKKTERQQKQKEDKARAAKKRKTALNHHKCGRNLGCSKCRLPGVIVCKYSSTKAEECDYFRERKVFNTSNHK